MENREQIERVRQAMMRFRELMDILKLQLADSERAYLRILSRYDPEETAGKSEKEILWMIAEDLVDDPSELSVAVREMRYNLYQIERDFEQVYNHLVSDDISD